ncbi:MAG: ABC transporter ATP-binding protein [Ruminococcaceae bacterium]|nr:ABC transporter ATP-binding protein [Oscillospiraceae bacterium]
MKLMLKYLRPFFGRMSVGLAIKIAGTVVELALPLILSHILGQVVAEGNIGKIFFFGGVMIICSAAACVLNIVANRMAARVARNFSEMIRHDLFYKIMHLSAKKIDEFTVPSLESRITSDTYHTHHFVGMMQRMGVRAPILLIGGIGVTLFMDATLALVMIAVLPFIFITVFFVSRKGVPLYSRVQVSVDKMIRVVREDAQGMRVIKALSKTEHERDRYDAVNRALVEDERRAGLTMGIVNPAMTLLMNLGSVLVVLLGANLVMGGRSNPETIIAFMQYFTQISMAMMTITRIFMLYTKSSASAKRIEEVLEAEDEISVISEEELPRKDGESFIVFDDVSFSYKGKRNDLSHVSFSLERGESLGIIGSTGSGKSTVISLLLRYYDVGQGSIRIDGRDVRTIDPSELHSMFGVALQNDFLYADTIEENIRFGRDISPEKIREAARIAQAHDFIEAFSEGYDRMLASKGTNVSGGQKQRMLIARAVAGDPDILILDDSSSALDYKTDANLRRALATELSGTTKITVAQRVSSVMSCDLIIVLEHGEIADMGTHDELLARCDIYRGISDSQMGGAIVE